MNPLARDPPAALREEIRRAGQVTRRIRRTTFGAITGLSALVLTLFTLAALFLTEAGPNGNEGLVLVALALAWVLIGGSALAVGAPKIAIKPSPIYLSRVPPCSNIISVITEKYRFSRFTIFSGFAFSDREVKPRISANNTVTCWFTPPSRNEFGLSRSCLTTYSGMNRL